MHAFLLVHNYVFYYYYAAASPPGIRDLYKYITPHYAVHWKEIGTLLNLPSWTLDIIKHDNIGRTEACCNAMLKKWLQEDHSASWKKLLEVIESPAVSSEGNPINVVQISC